MKILFYTFPEGHLVSDKEFERLKKGFAKVGIELIRWHKDKPDALPDHDIAMVKGFSHIHDDVKSKAPLVYYSIGTEWKVNDNLDKLNEPLKDLYALADYTVHISQACQDSHIAVFGKGMPHNETTIIPACEPNLPTTYRTMEAGKLKLATTCIPRPVKRIEELEQLCKEYNVELVPAYGTVTDFSYYHDCDGYIQLSRKEGMPNNVLEAMAYGLPCIVTNYGGAKEAVGNAGIVIKNDPDNVPWDPSNINPIDKFLFQKALIDFVTNHSILRFRVRERVLTELNDYVTACKFKAVFASLL